MLSRGFLVLWLAMFVAMSGIAMVSPLLPVYVREELGGPEIAVALSFSSLSLAQIATSPFVGRLGDRYGQKRFIVGGFLIYGLGALGYVAATNWELVIAFRTFSGFGAAAIFPMALAYVGHLAPRGQEGRYMGLFTVAQMGGFGFGPLLGGAIRDVVSADAAFLTMAGLLFGVGLLTLLLLPAVARRRSDPREVEERRPPAAPFRQLLRSAMVQGAVVGQTVIAIGWGAGFTFIAVYVISEDGLNTGSAAFVGILIASRSTIGSAFQPLTGMLADRYNRVALGLIGLSVAATGQFFVPDVPPLQWDVNLLGLELTVLPWLLLLFIMVGLGEALVFPTVQAILVDAGRLVGMGSVMGLGQMGQSLGFLSGSLLGAGVVSLWGLEAVFRYAGIVVALGAVAFVLLMRRAQADRARLEALRAAEETTDAAGAATVTTPTLASEE